MLSRDLVIGALAVVVAGCVQDAPLEFTCPPLEVDAGPGDLDAGTGSPVDAGACQPVEEPLDACDNEGAITNQLDGACFWEQCRDGERSLFRKPPGVPCVFRPGGTTEWTIGACNIGGVCTDGFIGEQK